MSHDNPKKSLRDKVKLFMNPKYELTGETKVINCSIPELIKSRAKNAIGLIKSTNEVGNSSLENARKNFLATMEIPPYPVKLYRIRALRDIPRHGVRVGDLGGWVSRDNILPQEEDSWIGGEAIVIDNFFVHPNVLEKKKDAYKDPCLVIGGNALISGYSIVISHRHKYSKHLLASGVPSLNNIPKILGDAVIDGDNVVIITKEDYSSCDIKGKIIGSNTLVNPARFEGLMKGNNFSEGSLMVGARSIVEGDCHFGAYNYLQNGAKVSGHVVTGFSNLIHGGIVEGDVVMGNNNENSGSISGSVVLGDKCGIKAGVQVNGNARLGNNVTVSGLVSIGDNVKIGNDVNISGTFKIKDNVVVEDRVSLTGFATLSGERVIPTPPDIVNTALTGAPEQKAIAPQSTPEVPSTVTPSAEPAKTVNGLAYTNLSSVDEALSKRASVAIGKHRKIAEKIASYESDIVKILQYPTFTDLTNDVNVDMVMALSEVDDISPHEEPEDYITAVKTLERTFIKAESNARKIARSVLDEEGFKKVNKANTLFAMVVNEAATETEKKNAFKQGMRSLEGIVDVPDAAVDALRQRSGLLELET